MKNKLEEEVIEYFKTNFAVKVEADKMYENTWMLLVTHNGSAWTGTQVYGKKELVAIIQALLKVILDNGE